MNARTKGLVTFAILLALGGCKNQSQQASSSSAPSVVQAAAPATTVPSTVVAHQPTPEEVWNQATPAVRRSILANHIRKTWKNVRVQSSDSVMTVTHPGMDEKSARQIIDDVSKLATSAGLRRINFVSAGGMCQVTYERPYCEIAGRIPGNSETGGTGCGPYQGHSGNGWTHTTQTYMEPCQPHTWVYDVPQS